MFFKKFKIRSSIFLKCLTPFWGGRIRWPCGKTSQDVQQRYVQNKSTIVGKVMSSYILRIEMQFQLNDVHYTRNLINIFIFFLNSIFLQFGSQTCCKNQLKLLICFLPAIDNAKNTCTFGLIIINFGQQYWAENKIWIVFPLALRTQPPFF